VKGLVFAAARLLGVGRWLRFRHRNLLLVLMYHGVVETELSPFCWHQLARERFRRQIAWIRRHYVVLPLEQALALRREGRLPPRSCAITFDDGYENVLDVAGPVLEAERVPATVFLVTELVGTDAVPWPDRVWLALARTEAARADLSDLGLGVLGLENAGRRGAAIRRVLEALKERPAVEKDAAVGEIERRLGRPGSAGPFRLVSWEAVQEAAAQGLLSFGPHSRTHEILSRVGDAEVERQVAGSCEDLARRLGTVPRVFAYPNGRAQDFDERARRAVTDAGCAFALTTEQGLVGPGDDDLALPRVCVGADLSQTRFELLCAGW